ncbi:coagulation factor 5 8 type domain-containing protein [Fusarium heterosporum]|uniref:Coagulation factor 5 8 type domain-containing protein n=1 Tax=Fusarium heterosporum TaxID=42747 RepID=A0A8H5WRB9_FUSHE|nr:coagulation factor 5 8 type domain-containing protein [Fusarium heterosporum]
MRPLPSTILATIASSAMTNFLDPEALLEGLGDRDWFKKNIPLLDVPDKAIQQVYYYRWQTYKEHLVYTGPQYGYMASEFLRPVSYGAPYGGIVAATGHHITEGRWLRDTNYGQDIANYWLSGPGQFPKPMKEEVNKDTSDWAHEYSFWAASALWKQYLVTGDRDFIIGQLENLVKQYRGWDSHFNEDLGLYWQVPVWDATEYTAASYESSDPYHGGAGFRPTINSYQYGDAWAISQIAALSGDKKLEEEYRKRAESLSISLQKHLWDDDAKFYKHRARDDNPSGALIGTREIMGYLPWAFNVPNDNAKLVAFSQLTDPKGFSAKYGPTTAERRSKWYMYEAESCCRWNGPSWPFATAQTLTAVENVLNNYPTQSHITASDYFDMIQGYAKTQYKNGKPYVAEAHHPDTEQWIYDGENHSEDYNHSTFIDNVLAGLIGLRAQADDTIIVNPLTPSSWDYFAVENVAYHGHSITVLWDKTGSRYNQSKGLQIYVDGKLISSRDTIGLISVQVGPRSQPAAAFSVNIAANGQRFPQLTTAFASYTSPHDDAMRAIDGIVWRTGIPQNSRWTSYNSPNPSDFFGVNLRRNQVLCNVHLFFYDDAGGVRLPSTYDLQYKRGGTWVTIPNQVRSLIPTTSNVETKITFPTITTSEIRVVAPNAEFGVGWGLSELQIWTPAIFHIRNENSGKFMGVEKGSTANRANIQQFENISSRDILWRFTPSAGGWWKLHNVNSGLLLAVEGASTANSANLQQFEDSGTDDRLWRVESKGDGHFLIWNKNSCKVAGVNRMLITDGANVVQFDNTGTKDHLWSLLPASAGECSKSP